MSNVLLAAQKIARMTMVELENDLVIGKLIYRDYAKEFGPGETGTTVSIRRPVQFSAVDGPSITPQDITDANISLIVNKQKTVPFTLRSSDMALNDELLADRFARPAARVIAETIEQDIFNLAPDVPHWVGTPGQTVKKLANLLAGTARLTQNGVAAEDRFTCLSPLDLADMSADQSRLNAGAATIGALRQGSTGRLGNTDVYESNLLYTHTVGALGGTPLVNGATQNVTYAASKDAYTQTLNVDGASNSIANWARRGDVFTISGVKAVNPVTKATLPHDRQFVVTADASSNGSGQLALTISPPIITTGPYQTVSAAPANDAPITLVGTASTAYIQNLVMHKNAFALAMIPLPEPPGAAMTSSARHKGFSLRIVCTYDGLNDTSLARFDVLYGVKCINPELAVRLSGTT